MRSRTFALLALAIATALITSIAFFAPVQAAADPPPSDTITLKPGLNAVGWVAETRSTESLFNEILQLESIWSWDNWDHKWRAAARDIPATLHTLKRLTPGQAVLFSLSGNEEIQFTRPLEVVTGTVSLTHGPNLATWLGRNQVPLSHALKGIGRSLQSARVWDDTAQNWMEPAANTSINRGEPLLINATWPVQWLQPTYVMPPVSAPRHPSEHRQQQADEQEHEDYVRQVLEFYDNQWAIQADPFRFAIYAPSDRTAFARQLNEDGIISEEEVATHGLGCDDAGGYASYYGYVICPNNSRLGIHAHEYFHVIQRQLQQDLSFECLVCLHTFHSSHPAVIEADVASFRTIDWMLEGAAEFAEKVAEATVSESADAYLASERERLIKSLRLGSPQLADIKRSEDSYWEYDLGFLAFDRLAAIAGSDAVVELFRVPRARWLGPGVRWLQWISRPTRFRLAVGVEFDGFLDRFAQWQCEQVARNIGLSNGPCKDTGDVEETSVHDMMPNSPVIKGVITGPDGMPLESIVIRACRADSWCGLGEGQSDSSGAFKFSLCNFERLCDPSALALRLGEECGAYHVRLDEVESNELGDLQIRVSIDACGPQITGIARVAERPDLTLSAVWAHPPTILSTAQSDPPASNQIIGRGVSTRDGRFWLTVPYKRSARDMDVLIRFTFDKSGYPTCDVFYDPSTSQGYVVGFRDRIIVYYPHRDVTIGIPPGGISDVEIVVDPADCG